MKLNFTALLLAFGLLWSCSDKSAEKQIVFMDTAKVFEQFEMKKDYDTKLEKDLINESNLLNTISTKIDAAQKQNDVQNVQLLEKDFAGAQQLFNQKFQSLSNQYTQEVNTRLNDYLKSFGKENNHWIILGSSGQGNVMYVTDQADITEEVVKYVNTKYSK